MKHLQTPPQVNKETQKREPTTLKHVPLNYRIGGGGGREGWE